MSSRTTKAPSNKVDAAVNQPRHEPTPIYDHVVKFAGQANRAGLEPVTTGRPSDKP